MYQKSKDHIKQIKSSKKMFRDYIAYWDKVQGSHCTLGQKFGIICDIFPNSYSKIAHVCVVLESSLSEN